MSDNGNISQSEWAPYESLLSFDSLRERLSQVESITEATFLRVLPSIQLQQDGPAIVSLFAVTETLLGEIPAPRHQALRRGFFREIFWIGSESRKAHRLPIVCKGAWLDAGRTSTTRYVRSCATW